MPGRSSRRGSVVRPARKTRAWSGWSGWRGATGARRGTRTPYWSSAWAGGGRARSRGRETPVVWDSGQFHHSRGHLVAVLDVELGHLGDPMMDLAGWRMRDSVLGFGD